MTIKTTTIAHALIFNQRGSVLLLKRTANNDTEPGLWDIPGGTVEEGEPVFQGLEREVKEESGLKIEIKNKQPILSIDALDDGVEYHKLIFVAKTLDDGVTINPEEHSEYEWVSLFSIPNYDTVGYLADCVDKMLEE